MRRHIGIMFGQGLAIVLMVGFLIGFSPVVFISGQAFAQLMMDDDFNDNSKRSNKMGNGQIKGQGQLERDQWTT